MRTNYPEEDSVVEITVDIVIDNVQFLHNKQYKYVRSFFAPTDNRIPFPYQTQEYHVLLRDDVEYSIPQTACVITNVLKTDLEQNQYEYVSVTRRDNIKDRLDQYIKDLPIAETKETFGKAIYTGEAYKQKLLKEKGDVSQ